MHDQAQQDHDVLTAEAAVTLKQYRQAVESAYQQTIGSFVSQQERLITSEAEAYLREASAATSHKSAAHTV